MDKLVCVEDFEKEAKSILDQNCLDFVATGADDEICMVENKRAFERWLIRPKMLVDVSQRSLKTSALGKPVSMPLGVSPTAMHCLSHPDGEIATAKACEKMGAIFTLSTVGTTSVEDVARAAPNCRKWLQVYVLKQRHLTYKLIERAEKAGFEALVVTVDLPVVGKRRANCRKMFKFPAHLKTPNMGMDSQEDYFKLLEEFDPSLDWEDIRILKNKTKLPIILKGILTAEDAKLGVEHGVAGIFVSNHGGRQLDSVLPTIDALEDIVKEVNGRCEIYLDGGVGRGSDIYKALALGAKMAFIGRGAIWGLAVGGQAGVEKVLNILQQELDLTMALSGTPTIEAINRECVTKPHMKSLL